MRDEAGLFRARFGADPTLLVTAPGRVNLIGEHVDYLGLDVLPVAASRALRLLVRERIDDRVRVENSDPRFTPATFSLSGAISPDPDSHWSNYVRAAAVELLETPGLRGLDVLVTSDLPAAAGLSSSSALVVGTGTALLACAGELGALDTSAPRPVVSVPGALEFIERMARAEAG